MAFHWSYRDPSPAPPSLPGAPCATRWCRCAASSRSRTCCRPTRATARRPRWGWRRARVPRGQLGTQTQHTRSNKFPRSGFNWYCCLPKCAGVEIVELNVFQMCLRRPLGEQTDPWKWLNTWLLCLHVICSQFPQQHYSVYDVSIKRSSIKLCVHITANISKLTFCSYKQLIGCLLVTLYPTASRSNLTDPVFKFRWIQIRFIKHG